MTTTEPKQDGNASQHEKVVEIEGAQVLRTDVTTEERQRERRVKWKIDLLILPLLSTVYFLASMVSRLEPL